MSARRRTVVAASGVVLAITMCVGEGAVARSQSRRDADADDPASRVVRITTQPQFQVAAGASTEIVLRVRVRRGYHIQSNHPDRRNYIATTVALAPDPAARAPVTFGEAAFPPPVDFTLGDTTIATFTGAFDVRIPLRVAPSARAGTYDVRGSMHYQACTATTCLFPRDESFEIVLRVRNGAALDPRSPRAARVAVDAEPLHPVV